MTINTITLAECPFCDDGGEVNLDTREADLEHLRQIPECEIIAGPDQRIILYNSHSAECGPCEHFVDLYGDINWDGEPIEMLAGRTSELCFAWRAPILTKIDPNELLFNHLLDLLSAEHSQRKKDLAVVSSFNQMDDLGEHEDEEPYQDVVVNPSEHCLIAYQPQAKYSACRFSNCWNDFSPENQARQYHVQGTIIFAEIVGQFFRELHVLLEKYKRDCESQ